MTLARRLWLALTRSGAQTSPDSGDSRLRGRTYAIPFDRVWTESVALVDGGLARWRLVEADDYDGVIRARAKAALLRSTADVTVRVALDADGQTRVDARAANVTERVDLGAGARHLARFFRALDAAVAREARPAGSAR